MNDFLRADLQSRFNEVFFLDNGTWQVAVTSCGGQILKACHCTFPDDVIFLGEKAAFGNGQAIRGGVPLCWPWFGASPIEGRPIQGFARTALWEVENAEKDFLRLRLPLEAVDNSLIDFPFELSTEIRLKDFLEIALVMKNCGAVPAEISCALHNYFSVSDCEKVTVTGLENTPFTVKGGPEELPEKVPLQIKGEICRLYHPVQNGVEISDPERQRKISVVNENSNSCLVWNPGAVRCAQISDLLPQEFHNFLCIECNRAGADSLTLSPGGSCRIAQKISVTSL